MLKLTIALEQETDGRWIADIAALPGVMVYGSSPSEAVERVKALALKELADQSRREWGYGTETISFGLRDADMNPRYPLIHRSELPIHERLISAGAYNALQVGLQSAREMVSTGTQRFDPGSLEEVNDDK